MFLQEPYPGWTVKALSAKELSTRVRTKLAEEHAHHRILAIEQSTFESRISGHPKLYRITFVSDMGSTNVVVYDKRGRSHSHADHWFDAPYANATEGALHE